MGRIIPYIMENQKCSKPPTRTYLGTAVARSVMAAAWNFSFSSNNQNGIFWYDLGHDINRTCKSQTCGLSLNIGEWNEVCQTIIIPSYLMLICPWRNPVRIWGYKRTMAISPISQRFCVILQSPAAMMTLPSAYLTWLRKITCFLF